MLFSHELIATQLVQNKLDKNLKIPTKTTQQIAQKYRLRGWLLPRSLIHILSIICNEKELCNLYMWTISFSFINKKYTCDNLSFYLKVNCNFINKFTSRNFHRESQKCCEAACHDFCNVPNRINHYRATDVAFR